MIAAVCGRAPPACQLLPPHPFLLPPAEPPPRVSQDWLSVTRTRVLPSLGGVAAGASVAVGVGAGVAAADGAGVGLGFAFGSMACSGVPAGRQALPLIMDSLGAT